MLEQPNLEECSDGVNVGRLDIEGQSDGWRSDCMDCRTVGRIDGWVGGVI